MNNPVTIYTCPDCGAHGYHVSQPDGAACPGEARDFGGCAPAAPVAPARAMRCIARIEYTVEKRGQAYRKSVECAASRVETVRAKLENGNGYNFIVSYAQVPA